MIERLQSLLAARPTEGSDKPIKEGIAQMERTMARFDKFLPEHRNKRRFGIVAAVDYSKEMENLTRERGFYFARIQDELFVLDAPESFRPRYFGNVGSGNNAGTC